MGNSMCEHPERCGLIQLTASLVEISDCLHSVFCDELDISCDRRMIYSMHVITAMVLSARPILIL